MLSHAKSLIFLLPMCFVVMEYLAKPLVLNYFSEAHYKRYRNALLIVLSVYFLTPNIFIFYLFLIVYLYRFKFEETAERIYLYVFLAVLIPVGAQYKVSLGPIQTLLILTQYLVLSAVLLIPVARASLKEKGFFYGVADFYVMGYYTLICILNFRGSSLTEGMRQAIEMTIVGFVPYIAISRSISSKKEIDRVLVMIFFALLPIAIIGLFEAVRSWQIISDRTAFLSGNYHKKDYRAGLLRARSVYFSPITLGTAMMLLLGIYMYAGQSYKNKWAKFAALCVGLGGSLSSFSRMPWAATFMVFVLQTVFNKGVFRLIISFTVGLLFAVAFIKFTPLGERVAGLIPFVGGEAERQDSVDYRSQLIEVGLDVASENIMFGTPYFMENPKMEVMRQGQGIIDMVNTHLTVLLAFGAVTLAFFWLMFLVPTAKAGFSIAINKQIDESTRKLAILLCSLTLGQLANLISMSNIDAIPTFYTVTLALTVSLLSSFKKRA